MGCTKEDEEFNKVVETLVNKNAENFVKQKMEEELDINQIVQENIDQIVNGDFHWIKMGNEQIRLFKSLKNTRLPEETFGEYKVRQRINSKMIKLHKKGGK